MTDTDCTDLFIIKYDDYYYRDALDICAYKLGVMTSFTMYLQTQKIVLNTIIISKWKVKMLIKKTHTNLHTGPV